MAASPNLIGCEEACVAALIDPEIRLVERCQATAARDGLQIRYVIDTHTHADHFSASHELGRLLGIPVVMHRDSPAPFADLRLQDGDTLLIGATGRTDLPGGDANALYDSLFNGILKLDPALEVFSAHDYKQRKSTTIGAELESDPRLQKRDREAFVEMMEHPNLSMPTHLTAALRTNMTGGKTVAQMLALATAATPFISLAELNKRAEAGEPMVVLDVREKEAFRSGHVPGARHLPRGQLELRVDEELPDPTARIMTICDFGRISTLAAATLRELGFLRTTALDGGMAAWREKGYPITAD